MIHDFWGQSIWASKEHDTGFSKKFLRDYRKEIDLSLIHRPTLGRITHAILESKDSSAGPDGIPFIVYRNLIDIAAPVLLEVALHIADGNAPPKGFNLGLLHLLPKKHTGLVQDTRPITVNNTDNRILAVVLVDCIEPAVQALIGQEQLLFLKKRHMTDHVRDVNRFYYSSLSKKHQMFILFLDTKKAFDSIHHDFLLAVLKQLGFPAWFSFSIEALLFEAAVSPILANDSSLLIPIRRGVKQGCPLSPLLFIICYDVMIDRIQNCKCAVRLFAAADDLAMITYNFSQFFTPMRIISDFAAASGLGINILKTVILPTLPLQFDVDCVKLSPWPSIRVVHEYEYLGCLFGYKVTLEKLFKKPFEKAILRLKSYKQSLKLLPVHKRIVIVNVFVTPIFMYLGQFFLIPEYYCKLFRAAIASAIIPWRNGFVYEALMAAGPLYFRPAIKDLWSFNMATLVAGHNFSLPLPPTFFQVPCPDLQENSLLISSHRNMALFLYLSFYCRGSSRLPPASVPVQRQYVANKVIVYNNIVVAAYGKKHLSSWIVKSKNLLHPVSPKSSLKLIEVNFSKAIVNKAPLYVCTIFLNFLCNSLFSDARGRHANKTVRLKAKNIRNFPCRFCGKGIDEYRHFFSDCSFIRNTFDTAVCSLSGPIPTTTPPSLSIPFMALAFPFDLHAAQLAVGFLAAVYFSRRLTYSGGMICSQSYLSSVIEHSFSKIISNFKSPSSKGKKRKDTKEVERKLNSIPPSNIVIYTDGSSFGNPGPSGAGAFIYYPGKGHFHLFQGLGHGTNNLGELWAAGMALNFIQSFPPPYPNISLISDSSLVLGLLSHGWKSTSFLVLCTQIRSIIDRNHFIIDPIWVPGHYDYYGNELADRLAKIGSGESRKGKNITVLAQAQTFSYRHYRGPIPILL